MRYIPRKGTRLCKGDREGNAKRGGDVITY